MNLGEKRSENTGKEATVKILGTEVKLQRIFLAPQTELVEGTFFFFTL